jgi:hypothetical protein
MPRFTDLSAIPPMESLQYTEKYSRQRLDGLRFAGDPLADAVATELHANHGGLTNIHDLLSTVREKAETCEGAGGDIFRDFLASIAVVPAWAEQKQVGCLLKVAIDRKALTHVCRLPRQIERGQTVHAMHTPFMGISLFSGSLVGGAVFSNAAIVTALAGNVTSDPTRRITETGMLLASLAFPGSLMTAGSEAHDSLTRVRLLHAALRHWLPRSRKETFKRGALVGSVCGAA